MLRPTDLTKGQYVGGICGERKDRTVTPNGHPLTEEKRIEPMNKHDRLGWYAKKRKEKSDDSEQGD